MLFYAPTYWFLKTEDMENIFGARPWGKKKDDENPLKDEDTQPSNLESEIPKV